MGSGQINIRACGVGKVYHAEGKEIAALCDVSFEVAAGASLGIIGRNGAGKSTLLKILASSIKPTSGQIKHRGGIGAILQLGWSFHPFLSGYDNIMMQAGLAGISKTTARKKYEEILDFSELSHDTLCRQVRTYSNGMYLRLAFATVVAWPQQTMVFDEVMTVGDAGFIMKCAARMRELKNEGHSIILASHNMDEVQKFCDRTLLLEEGRVAFCGHTADAIQHYNRGAELYADVLNHGVPEGFGLGSGAISQNGIEVAAGALLDPGAETRLLFHLTLTQSGHCRRDVALVMHDFNGRQLFADDTIDWKREDIDGECALQWLLPPDIFHKGDLSVYFFWLQNGLVLGCSKALSLRMSAARASRTDAEPNYPFYLKGALRTAAVVQPISYGDHITQ